MKRYTARTVQDAVNTACQELGVTIDELNYEVISETKTLFTKKAEIECYTIPMIQEYIEVIFVVLLEIWDLKWKQFLIYKMVVFTVILILVIILS